MHDLIDAERRKYADIWTLDSYATNSPGERQLPVFLDMIGPFPPHTSIMDAGCGSGKGALALQKAGFNVSMRDITSDGLIFEAQEIPFYEVCLWGDLKINNCKYDYVYCCDVMEHIPPAFTMLVVKNLLDACTRGAFFSISVVPDNFGIWIGETLHQTVMPFTWWRDNLAAVGRLIEARDMLNSASFFVAPQ